MLDQFDLFNSEKNRRIDFIRETIDWKNIYREKLTDFIDETCLAWAWTKKLCHGKNHNFMVENFQKPLNDAENINKDGRRGAEHSSKSTKRTKTRGTRDTNRLQEEPSGVKRYQDEPKGTKRNQKVPRETKRYQDDPKGTKTYQKVPRETKYTKQKGK